MSQQYSLNDSADLITRFFSRQETKAYSNYHLRKILNENRDALKIPSSMYSERVIKFMQKHLRLNQTQFKGNEIVVYSWGVTDELTRVNAIRPRSYFTHYSAVYIHQLSLQIPKIYYLNYEHAESSNTKGLLAQDQIDVAFSKPQRKVGESLSFNGKLLYLLNSKHTNRLGVLKESSSQSYYHYTDVERTLIDIAVRPAYSGGVAEVVEIYRNAKDFVNLGKLKFYLDTLDYTYPYHQVIGFYLEVAGYPEDALQLFCDNMQFDFYLTYNIRLKEYSERWKLFYPKGLLPSNFSQ